MRQYSFIFSRLVRDESDIIGLLAYSIYKRQKIAHIQQFVDQHQRAPTEDELAQFHQFTTSDAQISQYNSTAENNLSAFVDNLMAMKSAEVEQFYRSALKDAVKESGHGYWYAVWQGVASSALYTFLLGLLFFFLWSLQLGPKQVIEKVFNVHIIQDSTRAKSP